MLSKNNKQEQNRRLEEKNNRFSIRKFTVGTASVLIGAFFMGVSGTQTVHAADTTTVDVNSLKQVQAPSESLNSSLSLSDDIGLDLSKLLGDANKQFGDKNQTPANKDAQQPATSSDNKPAQAQQTNINDDLSQLQSDADKVIGKKVESKVTINVTLPNVEDPDDDYYWNQNVDVPDRESTAVESANGNYTWKTTTHRAVSLDDVLANTEFTNNATGNAHDKIPNVPGYRAKLVDVQVGDTTIPDSLKGKVEESNWDQENALQDELHDKMEANPYELPEYTTTVPYDVRYDVEYEKIPATPVKAETRERLNVTLPTSTDSDEDYYYGAINTDANDMSGEKSADGTYTWKPVDHAALDLNDALSKPDFVYAENGSWHNTLPSIPGYRAYISDVTTNSASPEDEDNEAEADALYDDLYDKITENPYEIPAYNTTTPINVYFYVEYEKVSENGEVVDTPALPAYTGAVAGIPETRPADKPFEGGVAGMPLTQEALPEAQVGVPGDALTEDALPVAKVSVPGEPLTQKALPEAQVGIAGEPLTQEALPEAKVGVPGESLTQKALPEARVGIAGEPLTEAALPAYTGKLSTNGDAITVPALPEYNLDNQTSDTDSEPVVTPETPAEAPATVAPHATDAVETEVVDNNVVEDDTTAPVHNNEVSEDLSNYVAQADTTVAAKNEVNVDSNKREAKHEATLPQTGAKTTAAGVLGLMMVGVAAVVGLAIDRKRKN
ncbi:YSIRK-type signal peptide-containing protein [Lactobacillus rodentium]|uniref:Gram-positive cocci surface proteins LPxTG domain-containing protein n=1 Tax=Lactobacillus rodentium TaxID=947835 RepID=A0A2Z6T8E4_9LACO|nr:YSIRK-type signal peptide-containing protein [Lactobacillus rodentium]MCR1894965.1 YSIRK-type signal peptide-containing protein [Lactobacillus rodentium]GBG05191.1 hypothetical protein LrDSM24759_11050 [Lactobacillus rodentium]